MPGSDRLKVRIPVSLLAARRAIRRQRTVLRAVLEAVAADAERNPRRILDEYVDAVLGNRLRAVYVNFPPDIRARLENVGIRPNVAFTVALLRIRDRLAGTPGVPESRGASGHSSLSDLIVYQVGEGNGEREDA